MHYTIEYINNTMEAFTKLVNHIAFYILVAFAIGVPFISFMFVLLSYFGKI